jgi:hypothetical protein
VGFFVMGVPAAGLLTLGVLLIGVVQVPATLVTLPIIAFVLATADDMVPAIIFSVWTSWRPQRQHPQAYPAGPWHGGADADHPDRGDRRHGGGRAPRVVRGAVLLAIGYVLFMEWLRGQSPAAAKVPSDNLAA